MLSVAAFCYLSAATPSIVMPIVIILIVVMLNVITKSDVMLSVVESFGQLLLRTITRNMKKTWDLRLISKFNMIG